MRLLNSLCAAFKAIYGDIVYAIKYNLRYLVTVTEFGLMNLMYELGKYDWGVKEPAIAFGIPLVGLLLFRIAREMADRANVGNSVPVPEKRFTEVDDDGEVSIPTSRTHELILYVADLEDYLERKGYL